MFYLSREEEATTGNSTAVGLYFTAPAPPSLPGPFPMIAHPLLALAGVHSTDDDTSRLKWRSLCGVKAKGHNGFVPAHSGAWAGVLD